MAGVVRSAGPPDHIGFPITSARASVRVNARLLSKVSSGSGTPTEFFVRVGFPWPRRRLGGGRNINGDLLLDLDLEAGPDWVVTMLVPRLSEVFRSANPDSPATRSPGIEVGPTPRDPVGTATRVPQTAILFPFPLTKRESTRGVQSKNPGLRLPN